jgi:hypothetical protein
MPEDTQRKKGARGVTTEAHTAAMLAAYRNTANVSRAAQVAGICRRSHYEWLASDATYAAAFQASGVEAIQVLEDEANRRAVEGVKEPVYQGGKLVGEVQRYSDTLLIFLLKGALPDKYRDNFKIDSTAKITAEGEVAKNLAVLLSPEELLAIRKRAAEAPAETATNVATD